MMNTYTAWFDLGKKLDGKYPRVFGTVIEERKHSYKIKLDNGHTILRHKKEHNVKVIR